MFLIKNGKKEKKLRHNWDVMRKMKLDSDLKSLLEYDRIKVKCDEKNGVVVLSIEDFIKLLKMIKE